MKSMFDTQCSMLKDRYGDLFEYSLNGMFITTTEGKILLVNKMMEDIFGHKRKNLIGKSIEVLVPDEIKKTHPSYVRSYMADPKIMYMGIGRDLYGKHQNGGKISVEIGLRPVYMESKLFVIGAVIDISYRKKIEEKIHEKTNELEEFAYRISHDLKAPLLSIFGLADCITDDLDDKNYNEIFENTQKIKTLTSSLNIMVQKILILTKADLKNEEYEIYDFENYITLARQNFIKMASDKKVSMESRFGHKKNLLIQTTRMTQILDNLVSNAIKYSNDKQKKKFVRIHTKNDSNYFYIKVEDNGHGIPSEKKDEIFSMFLRFHKDSTHGMGLGLYMVRKLVKKMNGKISYDSNSKGTVFNLKFLLSLKQ